MSEEQQLIAIATDESCPDCEYPELTSIADFNNLHNGLRVYMCGSNDCSWASKERPNSEED